MGMTGNLENPIHKLRPEHLIGLKDTTVFYKGLSDSLNMFWAKDYVTENNVELKRIK